MKGDADRLALFRRLRRLLAREVGWEVVGDVGAKALALGVEAFACVAGTAESVILILEVDRNL